MTFGQPDRSARLTRRWLVLDEVLAEAGDAGARDALTRRNGGSPSAAEAAEVLRAAGATVTRNSASRWVADPRDPQVQAWRQAVKSMRPLGTLAATEVGYG